MDVLDHAIRFAAEAHSGMTRKGTDVPRILHLMETAAIVGTMTTDREILAAAVLHDVVEDTGIPYRRSEKDLGTEWPDLWHRKARTSVKIFPQRIPGGSGKRKRSNICV